MRTFKQWWSDFKRLRILHKKEALIVQKFKKGDASADDKSYLRNELAWVQQEIRKLENK